MRVVSVNISEKKGMRKVSRPEAVLKTNWGIEGDSHADGSRRQLSLLGIEDIDYMRSMGADVKPGDFAENITTEGVELSTYPIGTHFRIGEDILLELTQTGKVRSAASWARASCPRRASSAESLKEAQ